MLISRGEGATQFSTDRTAASREEPHRRLHVSYAYSCLLQQHQVDLTTDTPAVQWWMQAHLVRESIYWRVVERGEGSKNCAEALALSSSPSNWMEPRGTGLPPPRPPQLSELSRFSLPRGPKKSRRVLRLTEPNVSINLAI